MLGYNNNIAILTFLGQTLLDRFSNYILIFVHDLNQIYSQHICKFMDLCLPDIVSHMAQSIISHLPVRRYLCELLGVIGITWSMGHVNTINIASQTFPLQ